MLVTDTRPPEMEAARMTLEGLEDRCWVEATLIGSAPSELASFVVRLKFLGECPEALLAQAIRGDKRSWG
jgi:hypothetical protein